MPISAKITALLSEAMTLEELHAMSPAQRQRFAALCHHWWQLAAIQPAPPKSGVLADVRRHGVHAE